MSITRTLESGVKKSAGRGPGPAICGFGPNIF